MEQPEKSSIGSIIGTIIIIAVIILAGLYFWGKRIEESKAKEKLLQEAAQQTPQNTEPTEAMKIKAVSGSDDLNSIEADLNNTKLDGLDSELNVQLQ